MKKFSTAILIIFLAIVSASAKKQDEGKCVIYYLPRTVLSISIDCEEQDIVAGPYARYAKEMLGINTIEKDSILFSIKKIELNAHTEADPTQIVQFHADEAQAKKLLKLEQEGLLVSRKITEHQSSSKDFVVKPVKIIPTPIRGKESAKKSADRIKQYREDRYNILIGNTDATYSGEALGDAIEELRKSEEELLSQFLPQIECYSHNTELEFIPKPGNPLKFEAFCFSDQLGVLPAGSPEGNPFYLLLSIENTEQFSAQEHNNEKNLSLTYREPAECTIKLLYYDHVICSVKMPIYQLGNNKTIIL